MSLPNLIICGAPKSGTSSLYFWLEAHPQVCASRVKETFFFADDINRFNKKSNCIEHTLDDYSRQWEHCKGQKVIFEATAPYIYFENALIRINELPTKPMLLFILREPAARVYSKYKFNKYKLKNFDGTFAEYISAGGSFGSGRHFEEGLYINYIEKWAERYGKEKVKLLIFEEMLSDRVAFMNKVAKLLDIAPGFYNHFDFFKRNETVSIKSLVLHRLGLNMQPYVPSRVQEFLLPLYLKLNSGKTKGKSSLEEQQVEQLKSIYAPFNRKLKLEFPELNLQGWRL